MTDRHAEFHGAAVCTVKCEIARQTGLDERKPDQWQRISMPAWRSLKKSIVAAGSCGAISEATAERLIDRFYLREL